MTLPEAREAAPFEEGVGDQMKDRSDEAADTGAEEHIAELTDGRIRQHPLNVVLHQTDAGGENAVGPPIIATNSAETGASWYRTWLRTTI